MLILKTNCNSLHTEAHEVVQKSAGNTMKVLKKGIERGEFRPDSNPYLVRKMIWGTIGHLVNQKEPGA